MSSNFGEIIKKLISVFGKKPARGLPKPPSYHTTPGFGAFCTWRKRQIEWRSVESTLPIEIGRREGGKNTVFL
jgi:hypothetical protein